MALPGLPPGASSDANASDTTPVRDDDSPWKEALERFCPEFLALLFPAIHAEIDCSQGVQFLDKEFQQIVREAGPSQSAFGAVACVGSA